MTRILIVNGWSEEGDLAHLKAKCKLQSEIFVSLVKTVIKKSKIDIFNSYRPLQNLNLNTYNAFIWTGGGGNIYEKNFHNSSQLNLCEKILKLQKPLWGSCWGMQVVSKTLGVKVSKSKYPEFGLAKNIRIINPILNKSIYKNKNDEFDAPAHHYDIIETLPNSFISISENNICYQSIYSQSMNIFCTQYHPELPYDYISNLMIYWKNNYNSVFSEKEFYSLVNYLKKKEFHDNGERLIEFNNWLAQLN